MLTTFKFQPTLNGENVSIRALVKNDFESLYLCASDKKNGKATQQKIGIKNRV
jgi:hypothetical protein